MTDEAKNRALVRIERNITVAKTVRKKMRDRNEDTTDINTRIAILIDQARTLRKQEKP